MQINLKLQNLVVLDRLQMFLSINISVSIESIKKGTSVFLSLSES